MSFDINPLSIHRDSKRAEGRSPHQLHPHSEKRWIPPWKLKPPLRRRLLTKILCHILITLIQRTGPCRKKTSSAILLKDWNLDRLTQKTTPHKLWTNWLKCWNLVKVSKTPWTKTNIALRSEQKICGLFDKETAGDSTLDVVSAMPGTDLLIYDEGMDKLEEIKQVGNLISGMDAADLEEVRGLFDANFLDSLTDLSQFAPELQEMPSSSEVVSIEKPETDPVVTVVASSKRAFEEVAELTSSLPEVNSLPDHDYVSKRCKVEATSQCSADSVSTGLCAEDKYRERRRKNNIASRRSREQRKTKYQVMEIEADKLVIDNERMRVQIVELEKLAAEMKKTLITKIAGK